MFLPYPRAIAPQPSFARKSVCDAGLRVKRRAVLA
jgi:hypothetical protein